MKQYEKAIIPGVRIRGSKGQAIRKRRLDNSPLCEDCYSKGFVTAADEVDHIIPLAKGGKDIDTNCRSLCKPCHSDRTREQFGFKRKYHSISMAFRSIEPLKVQDRGVIRNPFEPILGTGGGRFFL